MFQRKPARKKIWNLTFWDGVIIVIAIALSALTMLVTTGASAKGGIAIIEVGGREVMRFSLERGMQKRTIKIKGIHGMSKIEINGEKVRMVESACRDKICVRTGWIDSPGKSIVCLPNRVVIRIVSPKKKRGIDSVTE